MADLSINDDTAAMLLAVMSIGVGGTWEGLFAIIRGASAVNVGWKKLGLFSEPIMCLVAREMAARVQFLRL